MKEQGVAVYEILPDNCLNGVYSNNLCDNKLYNEIARKKSEIPEIVDKTGLSGVYECAYTEMDQPIKTCELHITTGKKKNRGEFYFLWKKGEKDIFEGSGWKTKENQITVSYRSIKS